MQCQTFVNMQWHEIDLTPLIDRISVIEQQINETREGNAALQELGKRIKLQAIRN